MGKSRKYQLVPSDSLGNGKLKDKSTPDIRCMKIKKKTKRTRGSFELCIDLW